ncbi:hypothetical protein CC2G_005161 [Coprinopsis cinerea AmutBmut pab1-1]|nr:hypothetical protein CC2G_005161 [Coprinopsis cinerea AmutBmut pab1-1]
MQTMELEVRLSSTPKALTFHVFDGPFTIDIQVSLVWPTAWNHVKIIYFLNRLMPIVIIICQIQLDVWPTQFRPYSQCKTIFSVVCLGITLSLWISEVILYFRVYAISGRGRIIKYFLMVNAVFVLVSTMSLVGTYLSLLGTFTGASDGLVMGCPTHPTVSGKPHDHLITISFAILLYSGMAMMVLSVYYGLRRYWRSLKRSPLVKVFYRDGTVYFIALAGMSILNGVAALLLPLQFRLVMTTPQMVVHTTLCTRMILHLREAGQIGIFGFSEPTVASLNTMAFRSGEPADRSFDISSGDLSH